MEFATADLSDAHPDLPVAEPLFTDFGAVRGFAGPIATVKLTKVVDSGRFRDVANTIRMTRRVVNRLPVAARVRIRDSAAN